MTLEERVIQLAGRYKAEQQDHAAKAGYKGEHATSAKLLERVVVDLEAALCDEDAGDADAHAYRQLRATLTAGRLDQPQREGSRP